MIIKSEPVVAIIVAMMLFAVGIQLGIAHGRQLQYEEDVARQIVPAGTVPRWVETSRDTIAGTPGLVIFTVEDYVWHTVTLYAVAHGDTILSAIIEPDPALGNRHD